MAELTIEEARKIYASSDEMKSLMLTKYTKDELDGVTHEEFDKKLLKFLGQCAKKDVFEKHKLTQEEFDNTFIELLGQCTKTVFLDENGFTSDLPTNRIELRNSSDEWLFDITFIGNYPHFWVNYSRVWKIFKDKYSLQDNDITKLMKNQVKIRFGLDYVTPCYNSYFYRVGLNY